MNGIGAFGYDPRERSFGQARFRDIVHAYGHLGAFMNNNYH